MNRMLASLLLLTAAGCSATTPRAPSSSDAGHTFACDSKTSSSPNDPIFHLDLTVMEDPDASFAELRYEDGGRARKVALHRHDGRDAIEFDNLKPHPFDDWKWLQINIEPSLLHKRVGQRGNGMMKWFYGGGPEAFTNLNCELTDSSK